MNDKHKVIVLAGIFAVSNMGQPTPARDKIARAKSLPKLNLYSSVMLFAEQYMETDEHEEAFNGEGRLWQKLLTELSDEEAAKTWPDLFKAYDEATPADRFPPYDE